MLSLALSACTAPSVLTQHHQVGTIEVGADLPLSGDDAGDGLPVRDAITLAIEQAGSVCGPSTGACVAVRPVILDDVNKGIHDPAQGAQNVRQLVADARVLGMVGPLYDGVARREIPIAAAARLAMISPANTEVCLTQEPADGHCQGLAAQLRPQGQNPYFRVVSSQLSEGAAAAELAFKALQKRRVDLVTDGSWLAQSLAASFTARFTHEGGSIVSDQRAADLVYAPGSNLAAIAALRRQLATPTADVPVLGSDALSSPQYAFAAGAAARGSYYTVVGPSPPATRSAASFVARYKQRTGQDATTTCLAAYDATGLLLSAVARAIDDAGGNVPTRSQVLKEVAATSHYAGAMGSFGFDSRGDTTLKWVASFEWLAPTDRAGRFIAQYAVN